MAQGDLLKLLKQAEKKLGKDTEWYRTYFDLQVHTFSMSVGSVKAAIADEIGPERLLASEGPITLAAASYVAEVYRAILAKRAAVVKMEGGPENFSATLTAKEKGSVGSKAYKPTKNGPQAYYPSSGTSVFRLINDAKREPQKKLVRTINDVLGTELSSENFIDTGHDVGVAEKQVSHALGRLSGIVQRSPTLAQVAAREARLEILSKFNKEDKVFVISVSEESAKKNRSKATQEKAYLDATRKIIREIIEDNKDWANQGGSDSKIENIRKSLITVGVKHGGKVRGKQNTKPNKAPSKVSTKIRGKVTQTASQDVLEGDFTVDESRSLYGLIGILNARLPPAVRSNMHGDALHNKTGNFSESVRIVGIRRNPSGAPTLEYTYQRSPYDVFDPALGRAPWNKPGRDPKRLIDKSIRDIARDLAIGRFYTRRA